MKILTALLLITSSISLYSQERTDVQYHDWNRAYKPTGPNYPIINSIEVSQAFDESSETFSYFTGGISGGKLGPLSAPTEVIGKVKKREVSVRVFSYNETYKDAALSEAQHIATAISSLTIDVWPKQIIAVEIDLYYMPEDTSYSLARKVNWSAGDPFSLAIFTREAVSAPARSAIHELYHVLATRWQLGRKAKNIKTPYLASVFEEVAASLYEKCGNLLAAGIIDHDSEYMANAKVGEFRFVGGLSAIELKYVLVQLTELESKSNAHRVLLQTALNEVLGKDKTIHLDSEKGKNLTTLCENAAQNPLWLGQWFVELAMREDNIDSTSD